MSESNPAERIELALRLLREAENLIPADPGTPQCIQASEKIWGAWVQATKAYKHWETTRAYGLVLHELYERFPQHREVIHSAASSAGKLHSYGFYEGAVCPISLDIEKVWKGVETIKKILEVEHEA